MTITSRAAGDRPRDYALTLANVADRTRRCRAFASPRESAYHSQSTATKDNYDTKYPQRPLSPSGFIAGWGLLTTTTAIGLLSLPSMPRPDWFWRNPRQPLPAAPVPVNAATPPTPALVPDVPVAESGPRFSPAPNEIRLALRPSRSPVAPAALPPQLALQPQVALSALPSVTSVQVQVSPESPFWVTPRLASYVVA